MATKISRIFSLPGEGRTWGGGGSHGDRRQGGGHSSTKAAQVGTGSGLLLVTLEIRRFCTKKRCWFRSFFFFWWVLLFLGTCWYLVQNPQTSNDSCYSVTGMAEIANYNYSDYSELFDFRGNGDWFSWNLLKTIDILAPFLPGKQMTQSLRRRTTSWRTSRAGVGT